MANEIKFRSEMPRIKNLDRGDAFLISRADGTAGYTLLADAVELRGAPFTYDQFTPSQLAALKGATGAPLTYDDLTTAQKAELVGSKLDQTLPAAAEVDDVARLYAQKTDGSPVLASATQIRELTGIDYSLLTEQIVPGEYYIGFLDGIEKRPVYTNTASITLPATMPDYKALSIFPMGTAKSILSITGQVLLVGNYWVLSPSLFLVGAQGEITLSLNENVNLLGLPIIVTAKYTK